MKCFIQINFRDNTLGEIVCHVGHFCCRSTTVSKMKSLSSSQTPNEPAMTPVRPQFWTLDEAAQQLKLSSRSFFDLRGKHPFYEPDGSRNTAQAFPKTPGCCDSLFSRY